VKDHTTQALPAEIPSEYESFWSVHRLPCKRLQGDSTLSAPKLKGSVKWG
jgi:hypothetical protein